MIIALTKPVGNKFSPRYFHPENFEHELFSPNNAGKTDLMDPPKVLRELGLSSNYLEEPPFCYIRSYAPIWEYYLIALNVSMNNLKIDRGIYEPLSGTPYKSNGWKPLDSGRAVGNADYDDWKNNYQRFSDIANEYEKRRVAKLAEQSEEFAKMLVDRSCPIRQCRESECNNPEKSRFLKSRRMAAKAFASFLLNDGATFSEDDANELVQKGEIYEKLIWLLNYFSKKQGNDESYKHVLSASLLLSLYGFKGSVLTKTFVRSVLKHVKDFSKQSDLKVAVCRFLENVVSETEGADVRPPLANIYKERDRLSLTLRISSWLHLLEGALNAQR